MVEVVGARPFGQGQADIRGLAQGRVGARGDGDQRHAETARVGDDVGKLRALAGPRHGEHHVVIADHAEIAVAGLCRVHKVAAGAGRRQGGGYLAADMAGFAHAGDDHIAGRRQDHRGGSGETRRQPLFERQTHRRQSALLERHRAGDARRGVPNIASRRLAAREVENGY